MRRTVSVSASVSKLSAVSAVFEKRTQGADTRNHVSLVASFGIAARPVIQRAGADITELEKNRKVLVTAT